MAAQSHYLPALHKLFRTRPVALLSDLRKALQTPSRTTVFRVLSSVGYLASYSHAGHYYTLKRIPQFDPRGLWHYRQIGFSSQRTLRATLVHLVETSPAGQTHEELQEVLLLRVHNTLRLLVRARELQRKLFQDVYVYLSAKPKPASRQWAERQKLARHRLPRNCIPLVSSTFSSISFIIQRTTRAPFASDCVPGGTRSRPSRSTPSGATTI